MKRDAVSCGVAFESSRQSRYLLLNRSRPRQLSVSYVCLGPRQAICRDFTVLGYCKSMILVVAISSARLCRKSALSSLARITPPSWCFMIQITGLLFAVTSWPHCCRNLVSLSGSDDRAESTSNEPAFLLIWMDRGWLWAVWEQAIRLVGHAKSDIECMIGQCKHRIFYWHDCVIIRAIEEFRHRYNWALVGLYGFITLGPSSHKGLSQLACRLIRLYHTWLVVS